MVAARSIDPIRSALYVPANKPAWLASAADHEADVVILDLEDAVAPSAKAEAREHVTEHAPELTAAGQRVYVRINGHANATHDHTAADIEAAMAAGVEGLVLPDVTEAADITATATVLDHIERREGRPVGETTLMPIIETAAGMRAAHAVCAASERVRTVECGAVKGADTERALGFEWTGPGASGLETVHLLEKVLMDARAAGVEYPLSGPYVDIEDIEGLRADMQFAREVGYDGYVVIHPDHVAHANDIYLPDAEMVEYWIGAYNALQTARETGDSAVRYEGEMIDTAMLDTARRYLRVARAFESELDLDIEIPAIDG